MNLRPLALKAKLRVPLHCEGKNHDILETLLRVRRGCSIFFGFTKCLRSFVWARSTLGVSRRFHALGAVTRLSPALQVNDHHDGHQFPEALGCLAEMGVSIVMGSHGGSPKWLVYKGKSQTNMDD